MLRIEFSQNDVDELFRLRYEHPLPYVQKRMEALYLKSQGVRHQEICELLRTSKGTLVSWIKTYKEDGLEGLMKSPKRKQGQLYNHQGTLEEHFKKNPPSSVKHACKMIEQITGLKRSETCVRRFLKGIGMSLRKTGIIPGKADPEQQAEFKKKFWSQSLLKLRKEKEKCIS